jgi:hypothetical protein
VLYHLLTNAVVRLVTVRLFDQLSVCSLLSLGRMQATVPPYINPSSARTYVNTCDSCDLISPIISLGFIWSQVMRHYTAMWTRQGSVHLSVTHDVYPNGAPRCVFNVTDTGVGIAGDIDVFAKYHQPHALGKAPKGGSELSQIYAASVQQVGTVRLHLFSTGD